MKFTEQDFIESAAQGPVRVPSPEFSEEHHTEDNQNPQQSPMDNDTTLVCPGRCDHGRCRTYNPVPQARRQLIWKDEYDGQPLEPVRALTVEDIQTSLQNLRASLSKPLTPIGHVASLRIYLLHERLADVQQSIEIRDRMIDLFDKPKSEISSGLLQRYRQETSSRYFRFNTLVDQIRRTVIFFGFIDMPDHKEFMDTVQGAGLFEEELDMEELPGWISRAEKLRLSYQNYSERIIGDNDYDKPYYLERPGVFKDDWSFVNSNPEGTGSGLEEHIAPNDTKPDPNAAISVGGNLFTFSGRAKLLED